MESTKSRIISHRGNLNGPNRETENTPLAIAAALLYGFDVEVDIHWHQGQLWLGHDLPQHPLPMRHVHDSRIWFHAKDPEALLRLHSLATNCFSHDEDPYVLTHHGYIWFFHGPRLPARRAIAVLPETGLSRFGAQANDFKQYLGVCTDYPHRYQQELNAPHSDNAV